MGRMALPRLATLPNIDCERCDPPRARHDIMQKAQTFGTEFRKRQLRTTTPVRRRGWGLVVPVPREQFAEPVDRVALGHAPDHVAEPGLRIEAIEFGALQHGTEGSGALAAGFVGREPRRACKDTLFTGSPAPSMRCNAAVASVTMLGGSRVSFLRHLCSIALITARFERGQ